GGIFIEKSQALDPGGNESVRGPELVISHSAVDRNRAGLRGGGVFAWESSISMTGGVSIQLNYAFYDGGGLFIYKSPAQMDGVLISANEAEVSGGGFLMELCHVVLQDTRLIGNYVKSGGGGIRAKGGELTMRGCTIEGCFVLEGSGGGVFLSDAAMNASHSALSGCHSESDGGGIYAIDATFDLTMVVVHNSRSSGNGGAVSVQSSSMSMTGGAYTGNTAGGSGGGIHCKGSIAQITEVTIGQGIAEDGAGAGVENCTLDMTQVECGSTTVHNSTLRENSASHNGAAVADACSDRPHLLRLQEVSVTSNTVADSGSVFFEELHPSADVLMDGLKFERNGLGNIYWIVQKGFEERGVVCTGCTSDGPLYMTQFVASVVYQDGGVARSPISSNSGQVVEPALTFQVHDYYGNLVKAPTGRTLAVYPSILAVDGVSRSSRSGQVCAASPAGSAACGTTRPRPRDQFPDR
ncbi:hypothetical protein CYMTET_34637, partial [Cymbomonas tetramitiformis]